MKESGRQARCDPTWRAAVPQSEPWPIHPHCWSLSTAITAHKPSSLFIQIMWISMICFPWKIYYSKVFTSHIPGSGFCFRISGGSTIKKRRICPKISLAFFFIIPYGLKVFVLSPNYSTVSSVIFRGAWRTLSGRQNLGTLMLQWEVRKRGKREAKKGIKECWDLTQNVVNYLELGTCHICFSIYVCSKYKFPGFPKYFSLHMPFNNLILWQISDWHESVSVRLIC